MANKSESLKRALGKKYLKKIALPECPLEDVTETRIPQVSLYFAALIVIKIVLAARFCNLMRGFLTTRVVFPKKVVKIFFNVILITLNKI